MKQQLKGISTLMSKDFRKDLEAAHYVGLEILERKEGDRYVGTKSTYHNFIFFIEGTGQITCNAYLGKDFKKGDLFFIPAATEVRGISTTDTRIIVLTFGHELEPILENYLLCDDKEVTKSSLYTFSALEIKPQIARFIDTIEDYLRTDILSPFLNELKLNELFMLLWYNYPEKELYRFLYPILISENNFKTRVQSALCESWSLNGIMHDIGMSPRTFSRRFKAEFGEPARYWLLKQKAKYIKLRLATPGVTLNHIIDEFGFTDMSHLAKFCKVYYQCTPTELIKQLRKENCFRLFVEN